MALTFNPPDWLIQEYLNRKSPYQEAGEGVQKALGTYIQLDSANQRNALIQQQIEAQKREQDIQGKKMFYEYGDVSGLPREVQLSIGQPVQGPPISEEMARQNMMGGAQGPLPQNATAPAMNPIIAGYNDYLQKYKMGSKGVALEGAQMDVQKTQSEIEKNQAMAEFYRNKPASGAKPQYRINPIDGSIVEIIPSQSGQGAQVNPLTTNPGLGNYKDVGKAGALAAGDAAMVQSVSSEIDRVMALNDNSYGGVIGAATMKAKSALNMGQNDPKFSNTADVINTMQAQVARVLKSTFGGQLSDGEREYLNKVYGALPKMSQTERKIAMQNVKTMLSSRRDESIAKFRAYATGDIGGTPDSSPGGYSGGPAIGEVRKGFRYIGGNPADKASWEKV